MKSNLIKNTQPYLIEFNKATIIRGNKKILDSASFQIPLGENIAILGPNGSGKSTLIKTITREYYPLQESNDHIPVRIFGQDRWNIFDLHLLLGIITGDLQNFCTRPITGRELILSSFFSSIGLYPYHKVTPAMHKKAEDTISFLEISALSEKPLNEMSTGEARQVLIAMALVHNPKALILDEPTNSLDLRALHKFRNIIRKLAQHGKSIIMVTHHLQDIIPEITRVILIKDGKIFKDGPKKETINAENLSALFSLPVHIKKENGYYYIWETNGKL